MANKHEFAVSGYQISNQNASSKPAIAHVFVCEIDNETVLQDGFHFLNSVPLCRSFTIMKFGAGPFNSFVTTQICDRSGVIALSDVIKSYSHFRCHKFQVVAIRKVWHLLIHVSSQGVVQKLYEIRAHWNSDDKSWEAYASNALVHINNLDFASTQHTLVIQPAECGRLWNSLQGSNLFQFILSNGPKKKYICIVIYLLRILNLFTARNNQQRN